MRDDRSSPLSTLASVDRLSYLHHLQLATVDRATIDLFLDPDRPSWAQFDPVTGYRLGDSLPRDGVDGSATVSTTQSNGARTAYAYADLPCRINTYGDSFTQCQQVSDGETWQEYLAAHLAEPVRNYGVGGFGVYQAFRRMLREEQTSSSAKYLIFYVYGDDHIRSLFRCRHATVYPWYDNAGSAFHCNFWSNIEMNLESGALEEHDNLLATPESVYRMTDPDWMVESLRDDLATQMALYSYGRLIDLDLDAVRKLAEWLREDVTTFADERPSPKAIEHLLDRYSFLCTKYVLTKAKAFAEHAGKQLLVVTFDPHRALKPLIHGKPRYDQEIIDFLYRSGFRHFDMNSVHVEDFKTFRLPLDDYLRRYFVGHYSPTGNHFFAHSIRRTVVEWLDPLPITYRATGERPLDFTNYLRSDVRPSSSHR